MASRKSTVTDRLGQAQKARVGDLALVTIQARTASLERVRGILLPRPAPVTRRPPPKPGALASSAPRRSGRLRFSDSSRATSVALERVGGIEPPTQPWEGRVLPLNHTRLVRTVLYGVFFAVASLLLPLRSVQAQQTAAMHFDEHQAHDGWTIKLENGAELGVFPGVLPGPADVSWSVTGDAIPPLPEHRRRLGPVYRMTVSGVTTLNTENHRLGFALPDADSNWNRQIWLYDPAANTWSPLESKLNRKTNKFQAGAAVLDAYVTIVENRQQEEGIASWYCKRSCSSRYPALHGASNDFPIGSFVTVKNIANGRTVTAKIVSTWGQPDGRVIDLSWAAYRQLKSTNAGLTRVTVRPRDADSAAAAAIAVPVTAETLPALSISKLSDNAVPTVAAPTYLVYDQTSGTELASSSADLSRPIASLTKLMTAVITLDSGVSLDKLMTYSRADVTPYAYLRVRRGDRLSVKDLLYSLLVGSANNAATALARSTGLTTDQFVARMNAKAKSWGMTGTAFVDTSGLNPSNVSTARDMAILAGHAFHDYPQIRAASLTTKYVFTTRNTKQIHVIKSTDKLLLSAGDLNISGGKTGFLDEAKYTYILRTTNAQGAQVITVVLGAPTSTSRFQDAAKLAQWAWKTYRWS